MKNTYNAHEKAALHVIAELMSELIGGYENQMTDFFPEDDEYKEAYKFLHMGHDNLVEHIHECVMEECDGKARQHLKFAGNEFIDSKISAKLTKWGY